ncbi:MAG: ABC transporter ATP-binding protein [Bacteroidota bacterium]
MDSVKRRLKEINELFAYLPRALSLVWAAAKWWTLSWVLLLLLQGLMPGAVVYLTKLVLDGAGAAIGQGLTWDNAEQVVQPLIYMVVVLVVQQLVGSLSTWVNTAQADVTRDYIQGLVHDKAIHVDLAFFDSAESYNRLHQATSQASTRSLEMLQSMGSLFQNSITLVTIAALLIPYGAWIPLVLVLSTLPALWVVVQHNRRYHAWWKQASMEERQARYYDMMITMDHSASEVRIYDNGTYFKDLYQSLRAKLREEKLDLVKKQGLASFTSSFIGLVAAGGIMALMIWRALQGLATIGDLGLFYQAFNRGQALLRTLLSSAGRIFTSSLFLQHLFDFLELSSKVTSPEEPVPVPAQMQEGIRFEDVSFAYPGTERKALSNFDLHIPAGKVTAIVGQNGAGKSTFVKLLCRFYDPSEGTVTIDGTDIRSFDVDELRRLITVMFQFPMRYQDTAINNIAISDVHRPLDMERVRAAGEAAMLTDIVKKLPFGYETQLGRWFTQDLDKNMELSGGEWQRVSLARAFYRESPIIVLDEPTSAMDAWSEYQWMQGFGQLVEGRTALMITHRFTTAMHADVIYVMMDGAVVEVGTHRELLQQDGYYAQSWRAQMDQGWRAAHEEETAQPEAPRPPQDLDPTPMPFEDNPHSL